jgi:hypothetical protein
MLYRLLADALLVLHLGFIAWAALGGLVALNQPRWAWLHLPALAWGAWAVLAGTICPLTPLENHWRRLGGEAGYAGSFIERYLLTAIYPDWAQGDAGRIAQIALGVALLVFNAVVYGLLWRRRRRRR